MCITNVTKVYPQKDKTEGYGWKVFEKTKGGYRSPIYNINDKRYIKDKVYIRQIVSSLDDSSVNRGFHIFKKRKDAGLFKITGHQEVVKRVWYRGIVAESDDELVVKKMMIL